MRAMLDLDEHHWWYRGRRVIVGSELARLELGDGAQILDAGCGSGRTLEDLVGYGTVSGLELDPDAAEFAASRGCGEVKRGTLEHMPWDGGTFDLITCLDVLEHVADDRSALAELRRVAKPGGWLLVTVPAYQALWSLHDAANHHYRRYSRRTLRLAAVEAGWRLVRMTSFNSILLPVAAAVRLAQRHRRPDASYTPELNLGPTWLNSVLERPLRAEARWLDRGRTLPAGLSLLAVLENSAPSLNGGASVH
jgi:SAM-dependent methyltransferase